MVGYPSFWERLFAVSILMANVLSEIASCVRTSDGDGVLAVISGDRRWFGSAEEVPETSRPRCSLSSKIMLTRPIDKITLLSVLGNLA